MMGSSGIPESGSEKLHMLYGPQVCPAQADMGGWAECTYAELSNVSLYMQLGDLTDMHQYLGPKAPLRTFTPGRCAG